MWTAVSAGCPVSTARTAQQTTRPDVTAISLKGKIPVLAARRHRQQRRRPTTRSILTCTPQTAAISPFPLSIPFALYRLDTLFSAHTLPPLPGERYPHLPLSSTFVKTPLALVARTANRQSSVASSLPSNLRARPLYHALLEPAYN